MVDAVYFEKYCIYFGQGKTYSVVDIFILGSFARLGSPRRSRDISEGSQDDERIENGLN